MSFLDDAVSKATDVLDKATGAGSSSPAPAAGQAAFVAGEALTDSNSNGGISVGKNTPSDSKSNTVNADTVRFIHFGFEHVDAGPKFKHANYNPSNSNAEPEGHGIMFRDALAREAILLFGFVSSCKVALQAATKSRGAIEEVGAMASNLLGGGNTNAKPDAAKLDTFLSDIKAEADKINQTTIKYDDVNAAGKKLHEIRADYTKFCESLDSYYLKPPKNEGIGALAGLMGNIPGVGSTIQIVERILFKMFDLYLAAFLELRKNHERSVELAAHQITVDAVKNNYADYIPIFPVWFKKPEKTDQARTNDVAGDENKDKKKIEFDSDKYVKPVTDKIDEAKKKAEKVRDDLYDFAGANGAPRNSPQADKALSAAFSALRGGASTAPDAAPGAADCLISGLDATLSDVGGVPNLVKTVIRELTEGNIGLLEDVFARLMSQNAAAEIDSQMLLQGGRRYLTDKISKALSKLLFGMLGLGDDLTTSALGGGKALSAQQLMGKQIDERLGKFVEPVIQLCIGDLAGQLKASQKKAQENGAQTMEVYLGRLPWLVSIMFKNTFFPIWNLVAEEVFGTVAPPLKSALKEANKALNTAKDAVDTVGEYNRRAQAVQDAPKNIGYQAGSGVQGIDPIRDAANNETDEGRKRREAREKAEREKENLEKFYEDNDKDAEFPVVSRRVDGMSTEPEKDIPSVLTA